MFQKFILFFLISIFSQSYGQNFNPNILYLLDENEQTYLIRGNIPFIDGEFCDEVLKTQIQNYLIQNHRRVSSNFKLIVVSLLNTFTSKKEIDLEARWFSCHRGDGFIWRYPLFGYLLSPTCIPKSLRRLFYKTDIDGLDHLVSELNKLVHFDYGQDTVIYLHCNVGKDRTGEASACYLMRYKGYSYCQAMELNHQIAKRRLRQMSINAIRWYAYYLEEF